MLTLLQVAKYEKLIAGFPLPSLYSTSFSPSPGNIFLLLFFLPYFFSWIQNQITEMNINKPIALVTLAFLKSKGLRQNA